MKMNPVVHFEMPAEDKKRVAKFYARTFGWQTKQLGPEMGNYVLVTTTEIDESGFPKERGQINGGFFERTPAAHSARLVIAVEDIRESMKRVEQAGGKILGGQKPGEPDEIPGVGLYASFLDSEGNNVGMMQPTGMMGTPG
jgi:predicted enzyme related to lactoylglutathione lyase